jgi:SAM-dependent methyltransferase
MSLPRLELERQQRSNRNAAPHIGRFENHRRHLTALLARDRALPSPIGQARAPEPATLCVLGAGNAADLELEQLSERYEAIHLVDIDQSALARAHARQTPRTREHLVLHDPVDLSGMLERLDRWRMMDVSAEELLRQPSSAAEAIAARLGQHFDVVVSACLLSQMHLAVRRALGEDHPLFGALSYTLTLTHLRTLARLTRPGGRIVLATDVASERMAPLHELDAGADLRALLERLVREGNVFNAVNPRALAEVAADDPSLALELAPAQVTDAWLWHNGEQQIFLVCALELERRATT